MLTAIFGGTFNPLHKGHYEMLKALNEDSNIEEIFLMPDRLPPHKSIDFLADDNTRIEMCRLACEDFSKCRLCLIEFEREGKSYSFDTVTLLKERYPEKDFAFTIGGDMLVGFEKWRNHRELMKMLTFIVFKRADTACSEFDLSIEKFKKEGMRIILKENSIPDISSTRIRENFSECRELLPEKIYKFLKERGVYGE